MRGREYRTHYLLRVRCVRKVTRQELSMRMLDSNSTLWAWPWVQAGVSTISTENVSRSLYKTSMHSWSIYSRKMPPFFGVTKSQVFSALELVMCAVMLPKILHEVYSTFHTLSHHSLLILCTCWLMTSVNFSGQLKCSYNVLMHTVFLSILRLISVV